MRGLLLFVPILLASGCVIAGCDPGPAVSARGVAGADAEVGDGGFTLLVAPTDGPGGLPMAGAAVVAYWGDEDASGWGEGSVQVGLNGVYAAGPNGEVVVAPGIVAASPKALNVLIAVTGDDGDVHLHVPSNKIVGVVAAREGWTEEWVAAVPTGADGAEGTLKLPLFRSALTTFANTTIQPLSVNVPVQSPPWYPSPIEFGSPAAAKAYLARLVSLTGTASWTSGTDGLADLGIGIGVAGPDVDSGGAGPTALVPGAHSATTSLSLEQLDANQFIGAALRAGPTVATAYVAPLGLPVVVQLDGTFDRQLAQITKCGVRVPDAQASNNTPGIELAVGALALLAVAAIVKKAR